MKTRAQLYTALAIAGVVGGIVACSAEDAVVTPGPSASATPARSVAGSGEVKFRGLAASAVCSSGGDAVNPLVLPTGYQQAAVATEPSYADVPDMNTQNETGERAGRYLYRVHEVGSNGSLSVTDLVTGVTKIIAQRADWEALDPTVWTPWGTLLLAEETNAAGFRDPAVPAAVAGLVYEVTFNPGDPTVVKSVVARPAIGSKSHEGMRFDTQGNLYSISERTPGYIFKFVPDRKGDLSTGQSYVLKVTQPTGDRVGRGEWVPLNRELVRVDASAEADKVQATGYGRPEDVEIGTSSGMSVEGDNMLYVAITSEHRILEIDLREARTPFISEFVGRTINATPEFEMPDNLALDHSGNLFITEDPGGSFSGGKRLGDDIWVARPSTSGRNGPAASVERVASLTDCDAEPTGIYFDLKANRLFVNIQHRGGDHLDKTMEITGAK